MRREPGIFATDIVLAVTTLAFDIAGLELLLPLTSGARVVIASTEAIADGSKLQSLMAQFGVTFMQATPATWRLLLECGWTGSPRPEDPVRRRSLVAGTRGRIIATVRVAVEYVWSDRDHNLVINLQGRSGQAGIDWAPDRQYDLLCIEHVLPAGDRSVFPASST